MKNGLAVVLAVTFALTAGSANAGINGGGTSAPEINGGGSTASVTADQPSLRVIGPVEAYDAKHRSALVLGQTVFMREAVNLAVGDIASVVGTTSLDGVIMATTVKDEGLYIPGSSAIFLSGRVQKVNASIGTVTVNGITVDLTALMTDGPIAPAVGTDVQIAGTQPVHSGVVLANGINGGGVAAAGINGGGKALSGINGGGKAPSGINGGGKAPSGINGGGKAPSGINGGGKAPSGINGGGKAPSGINGGGKALSGINGGGKAPSGINGGGKAPSGINGGGKAPSGINGGGKAPSGINGGGKST
jgi:hypothetical protein